MKNSAFDMMRQFMTKQKPIKESVLLKSFLHTKNDQHGTIYLKAYTGNLPELILEKRIGKYSVSISSECFTDCAVLKRLTLPFDMKTSITKNSFKGCSNLEEVHISGLDNSETSDDSTQKKLKEGFFDDNGILYVLGIYKTVIFPENHRFTEYSVPEGLETLDFFVPGKNLKKVTFPKSLKTISFDVLSMDVEMHFQSSSAISVTRIPNERDIIKKNAIHVQAESAEITNLAKKWRWPIYVYSGENCEFRPDGYPEMIIDTSLIQGTDELEITGGTEIRGNITIPEKRDGHPIVRIADKAFEKTTIDSLVLPDTIREIGKDAFSECSIKEIIIPASVEIVDNSAFRYSGLEKIRFAGGQCRLGTNVFLECSKLEEVMIDADITCIPDKTFEGCKNLVRIKLSDSTEEIGDDAFRECYNLANIELPNGLKKIGNAAFMCSGLKALIIPEGVTEIPSHLCSWCGKLESVSFSSDIRRIGFMAFCYCEMLKSIPGMNHLELLGESAFQHCTLLKEISIDFAEKIGENAIANTGWIYEANDEFVTIGNILVKYSGSDEHVTIPENITYIGDQAFMDFQNARQNNPRSSKYRYCGNEKLKSITVGAHVAGIGKRAFCECTNLETLDLQNPDIEFEEDVFTGTKLLKRTGKYFEVVGDMLYGIVALADRIAIPPEIRRILPGAFSGRIAKEIKTLVIGEGIRRLCKNEFHLCALDELVIPSTVVEISESAFYIERWIHSDGTKENILKGIGKIICTKDSPVIRALEGCVAKIEIVDEQVIANMMNDVRQKMANDSVERYMRGRSVIYGHELLSQVKEEFSLDDAVCNFEAFVEKNADDNMLDALYKELLPGMQRYGIASERWDSNWSAVAVTAAFLSQYGYLTSEWYHLTNAWYRIPNGNFMPRAISSRHPVLACYNYMRSHYCHDPEIRKAINYSCVYDVTVENKQLMKQAWQNPYNYCDCLYAECSEAESDKARIAYNRLIGVLRLLAELH